MKKKIKSNKFQKPIKAQKQDRNRIYAWILLVFMVFWTVCSTLGAIAFFRDKKDDNGLITASAASGDSDFSFSDFYNLDYSFVYNPFLLNASEVTLYDTDFSARFSADICFGFYTYTSTYYEARWHYIANGPSRDFYSIPVVYGDAEYSGGGLIDLTFYSTVLGSAFTCPCQVVCYIPNTSFASFDHEEGFDFIQVALSWDVKAYTSVNSQIVYYPCLRYSFWGESGNNPVMSLMFNYEIFILHPSLGSTSKSFLLQNFMFVDGSLNEVDYLETDFYDFSPDFDIPNYPLESRDINYRTGQKWGDKTAFNTGVQAGFDEGYLVGAEEGAAVAVQEAFDRGYAEGVRDGGEYSFFNLISAVIDVPIRAFTSLFSFDLLGFNLANFFFALLSFCLVICIVKLLL